ncbi:MAG: MFS transporter [Desulfocapsaceae bacterium]|nr:MFS transporter [Desulfocapsaceae bacterium]
MTDVSDCTETGVSRPLVLLMAIVNGVVIANLYYSQPLLAEIARDLHIKESQAGFITALTQTGYGFGLFLLTPLGDKTERRRLIVILTLLASGALAITGSVHSATVLLSMNFLIGLLSVVPQIIVPFIATLSGPAERGRNVGTVMSGLLMGILLARTVSGFIGAHLGWRAVYFCAALAMILLAGLIRLLMPASSPKNGLHYLELLTSLPGLLQKVPVLKEAALSGALLFAAFSVFWTTLVFHLESLPSHLGAQAAGCFGLVGAAGAIAASVSGRLADRLGARRIVAAGSASILLAWILMGLGGASLVILACGAALLDLGVQGAHVANQTRILAHMPEARSRINTIYIVSFFAGGACGSLAGTAIWTRSGWPGVCLLGGALMGLALVAGTAPFRHNTAN